MTSSSPSLSGSENKQHLESNRGGYFVTLMAGYYAENFHVDMPQTFHTTDRRIAFSIPSMYAELDYCNATPGQGVRQNYLFWGPQIQVGCKFGGYVRHGGLGAEPPMGPGAEPWSSPSEAETLLAFGRLLYTANLLTFLKFKKVKNQIFLLFLQKMKFSKPQYVTVYYKLMQNNNSNAEITCSFHQIYFRAVATLRHELKRHMPPRSQTTSKNFITKRVSAT